MNIVTDLSDPIRLTSLTHMIWKKHHRITMSDKTRDQIKNDKKCVFNRLTSSPTKQIYPVHHLNVYRLTLGQLTSKNLSCRPCMKRFSVGVIAGHTKNTHYFRKSDTCLSWTAKSHLYCLDHSNTLIFLHKTVEIHI